MKTTFKLGNVFGSIYHKGTLEFSPDGNHLLSPIGNKIISYDLKNNRSQCLGLETSYNIACLAVSPNGKLLLAATEKTQLYMVSLVSQTVLHRKDFFNWPSISCVSFSPNGLYYVVTGGSKALVYETPNTDCGRDMSPFKIHRVIKAHFDDITCVSWSANSQLLAVGSKDFTVKILPVTPDAVNTSRLINLSGHPEEIIGCFFEGTRGSFYDFYSLSGNAQLNVWQASLKEEKDLFENEDSSEEGSEEEEASFSRGKSILNYSRTSKHFLDEHVKDTKGSRKIRVTSCQYNCKAKILVTGFRNGSFLLQDIPDLNVIYSLQLSNNGSIDSLVINPSGDWIALGSSVSQGIREEEVEGSSSTTSSSQLVVWEWKTETFVMKQSGTGASVANVSECTAFSPDALVVAIGGTDCKIRLYDVSTGFCFVTLGEEHRGPITALEFISKKGGKVLASASLDGTVRCFDLNRYRNFKTFSSGHEDGRKAQFICLAVDTLSGDFIAAGAQNTFDIYLWSMQTGRLVEVLAGHAAPVSGVKFSPIGSELISCSWDQTVRTWGLFQASKSDREAIQVGHDCISLAMTPDGNDIAVSTLSGQIFFFDPKTGDQLGVPIEGKSDLGVTQADGEVSRDPNKYFTSLAFSADGQFILGGGNSKYICLYHKSEKILVKKFAVTMNLSMDGMFDYISKRKRSEFGFNLSVVRSRLEGSDAEFQTIQLPGVRQGSDLSERSVNPIIAIKSVSFSPTMRSFIATTTEGVLLFSLDTASLFDPFGLESDVTEESVRQLIGEQEYLAALLQCLSLNQQQLTMEVLESVKPEYISFLAASIPASSLEGVLRSISLGVESSRHLEFYCMWANHVLKSHAVYMKTQLATSGSLMSVLRLLSRSISKHYEDIGKLVDMCHNSFQLIDSINKGPNDSVSNTISQD